MQYFSRWEGDQLRKVKYKLTKNSFFVSMVKKGNFNKAPGWVHFFKSIDIGIQTSYSRLNATLSVSIFQMTLTSLPAQCPSAL